MNPTATYCGDFISDLENDDPYNLDEDIDCTGDQLSVHDSHEQERLSEKTESQSPLRPTRFYGRKT